MFFLTSNASFTKYVWKLSFYTMVLKAKWNYDNETLYDFCAFKHVNLTKDFYS